MRDDEKVVPLRGSVAWLAKLAKSKEGAILATVSNAMLILANDPDLKGMLGYDGFREEPLILRPPPASEEGEKPMPGPYPRSYGLADAALVQAYLQRVFTPKFNRSTVEDAMLAAAFANRFHPVLDWLASLKWDGRRRLDTWLINALACENSPYHAAVGAKFLIAAVRRLRQPGCKFDHMLVLEGLQELGKSTALRKLFGDPWFSDSMPADLSSRDAAMALHGVWCLEFAELDHLIRTEVETVKAFITRQADRYRPPYGKAYVDRPRQGVMAGTTNSNDYLRDTTGNRRFWPVACRAVSLEWIELHREQLWAEAAAREASGEAVWLEVDEVRSSARTVQADRVLEDAWHDPVADWVACRTETTMTDVLTICLALDRARQDRRAQNRVGGILTQLGWRCRPEWRDGKTRRIWRPVPADDGL